MFFVLAKLKQQR